VTIDFLSIEDVLQIHEDQTRRYGGMVGVKDIGLLQSALAQPQSTFDDKYLHADVFHMAAACLYHLCENHPFQDGNKRTAAVACLVFLDFNGQELQAPEPEFEQLVLKVASGKSDKDEIREFLVRYSKPAA
jgi:death-on-curing protein